MAVFFWLIEGWQLEWEYWHSPALVFFAIAGLLFPALGQRFQILSVKHVGPALTAAFGSFLPLFATLPAILFLNATVSTWQAAGIALVIAGGVYAAVARGVSWKTRAFYMLLLPLAAALVRAIAQPLTKAGYNILSEPMFATLVMSTISTLVVGALLVTTGQPKRLLTVGRGHMLFAFNGLVVGIGILSLQLSLVNGSVVLTASLVATTPIWTLLLSRFVFRNETLTRRHGIVAAMVTIGAVLVVAG